MTRHAISPLTGRTVDPEKFLAEAGPHWKERGLYPLCPSCGKRLFPWGVHSPNVVSNFHHHEGTLCPLSSTPDPRFAHLLPSGWDLERGRRLYARFCEQENLKQGYAVCRALCGEHLLADEFVAFCRQACRLNIWAYRDIPLEFIPYILVTLADLPRNLNHPGGKRRNAYRYVLSKVDEKEIDFLWIEPGSCRLKPVFTDTGNRVNKLLVRGIPDDRAEALRADTEWFPEALLRRIRECCDRRPKQR